MTANRQLAAQRQQVARNRHIAVQKGKYPLPNIEPCSSGNVCSHNYQQS